LPRYKSSKDKSSNDVIKEVMRRVKERAQRIDADWEAGPGGDFIARGNKIRVLASSELPSDARALIEEECEDSVEFHQFTRVIIERKRWVVILFPPLRHRF
jgi:hypothetical protein